MKAPELRLVQSAAYVTYLAADRLRDLLGESADPTWVSHAEAARAHARKLYGLIVDTPPELQVVAVPEDLRWVSWEQHGNADHEPHCQPVSWPPPAEVLAFWETGFGGGYCTVVALVRAKSEGAAAAIIQSAWGNDVGEWRFNREYNQVTAPGDRFGAPQWSIEMGRWPWKTKEAP